MTSPFSVRNQILLNMQSVFANINPTAPTTIGPYNPTGDPIGLTFSTVEIGPLEVKDIRKANSIGIVAGPETKTGKFPLWECVWSIAIEFRSAANQDDLKPGLIAERSLTAIERLVYMNRTWGGLAIDTIDQGNEIDLTSYADRSIMGVLKIFVRYRHSEGDPRIIVP
jgi:hypothetical protein